MSAKGQIPFIGLYDGDMTNKPTIAWGGATKDYSYLKISLKRTAEVKRLPDPNGQMTGYNIRQRVRTLSVTIVPRKTAAAGAVAAAAVAASAAPPELTKVTLAKLVSATDAIFNGDWIYEEGAENALSGDNEAEITFDMHQFFTDAGVLISADTLLADPS